MATGTTELVLHQTTRAAVAQLRQDKRLASLLTGLESGVRVKVPDDIRAALPALIEDAEMQLAPMNADDMQFELTGMMAAMGPGIPQAEKTEFMTVASLQLEQFPANLAREALHEAVSEVDQLRKVLPFVKTYCEDYPDRKRRRLDLLLDLQTLEESECG